MLFRDFILASEREGIASMVSLATPTLGNDLDKEFGELFQLGDTAEAGEAISSPSVWLVNFSSSSCFRFAAFAFRCSRF